MAAPAQTVARQAARQAARAAVRFPVVEGPMRFGPISLDPRQIVHRSPAALSMAFVNLKPLLPGHTLVTPTRPVHRVADLTPEELADMWTTAQRISRVLEAHHGATSFTMAIQDGKDAGQTVPHVHIHVVPRKEGDLARNDDVYGMIEQHEAADVAPLDLDIERAPRTIAHMAAEAHAYAQTLHEQELAEAPRARL